MQQPKMPGMGAVGAMTDTLELVKKMWGGMGVPGLTVPTLSAEEINKKITDLKTVESWLTMNMNMLRATIQTLEVQSGTIAVLQSMSVAMGGGAQPKENAAPQFESPFAKSVPASSPDATPAANQGADANRTTTPASAAIPGFGAAPVDPAAWWNVLQEQFSQAVGNAVGSSLASTATPPAAKPNKMADTPKSASKPAATTKSARSQPAARKRKPSAS